MIQPCLESKGSKSLTNFVERRSSDRVEKQTLFFLSGPPSKPGLLGLLDPLGSKNHRPKNLTILSPKTTGPFSPWVRIWPRQEVAKNKKKHSLQGHQFGCLLEVLRYVKKPPTYTPATRVLGGQPWNIRKPLKGKPEGCLEGKSNWHHYTIES